MRITAIVEACEGIGFRATSLVPSGIAVAAQTRDEALACLQSRIQKQFAQGEIVHFDIQFPGEPHPPKALAGIWKDHPDLAEVEENIRDYRRQVDADLDRP